jgi:hypothetical protein
MMRMRKAPLPIAIAAPRSELERSFRNLAVVTTTQDEDNSVDDAVGADDQQQQGRTHPLAAPPRRP